MARKGAVRAQKGGEGAVRCIEVCDLAVFSFGVTSFFYYP